MQPLFSPPRASRVSVRTADLHSLSYLRDSKKTRNRIVVSQKGIGPRHCGQRSSLDAPPEGLLRRSIIAENGVAMAEPLLLAIDQGTTSTRAIVFDAHARAVALARRELPQHYPAPAWVEHDAE